MRDGKHISAYKRAKCTPQADIECDAVSRKNCRGRPAAFFDKLKGAPRGRSFFDVDQRVGGMGSSRPAGTRGHGWFFLAPVWGMGVHSRLGRSREKDWSRTKEKINRG